MIENASDYLNALQRLLSDQIDVVQNSEILLYEGNTKLLYDNDKIYQEDGKCLKDLLRIIKIIDPIDLKYENTNVLTPRVYAESCNPIPQHISIQCLFFHEIESSNIDSLKEIIASANYNKTGYDNMWIGLRSNPSSIAQNDMIYIMNRRVGGWDGSIEHPVIELLCSGGHLPTVWDQQTKSFRTLRYDELLKKEIKEELGIFVDTNQIIQLGGFHNEVSNELVVLCALFIDYTQLTSIIENSKENYEENIDGVYMGIFDDVMELYNLHPNFFAGGEKAKQCNFPSNHELMKKVKKLIHQY